MSSAKRYDFSSLLSWVVFSLPTLIGYTFEAFGFPRLAVWVYEIIAAFNYPPALYHLGLMLIGGDGLPIDVDRAKSLMKQSSSKGYKPAVNWLESYSQISQESAEQFESLRKNFVDNSMPGYLKWWVTLRPYYWLAAIGLIIYLSTGK
jgi:TPR repeat protein